MVVEMNKSVQRSPSCINNRPFPSLSQGFQALSLIRGLSSTSLDRLSLCKNIPRVDDRRVMPLPLTVLRAARSTTI